jgi:hypothetical protein
MSKIDNSEIRNYLQALVGKNIEFHDEFKTEDLECYAEAGMRARLVRIKKVDLRDTEDEYYELELDFEPFDEFNKGFETTGYYDNEGRPVLTAREAGFYKAQDTIYPNYTNVMDILKPVDSSTAELVERFKQSGETNYVAWLECQVLGMVQS